VALYKDSGNINFRSQIAHVKAHEIHKLTRIRKPIYIYIYTPAKEILTSKIQNRKSVRFHNPAPTEINHQTINPEYIPKIWNICILLETRHLNLLFTANQSINACFGISIENQTSFHQSTLARLLHPYCFPS
jgi:hypothetical protein